MLLVTRGTRNYSAIFLPCNMSCPSHSSDSVDLQGLLPTSFIQAACQRLPAVPSNLRIPVFGSFGRRCGSTRLKRRLTQTSPEVRTFLVLRNMFLALYFHRCCLLLMHSRTSSNSALTPFLELPNSLQENESISFPWFPHDSPHKDSS